MKKLKIIIKRMLLVIIISIVALVVFYLVFINFYPSFGGDVDKERQNRYRVSKQYGEGKFLNADRDVPQAMGFSKMLSISRKFFFEKVENGRPSEDLEVLKVNAADLGSFDKGTRLIWFGHSAFLLQINGKNILIDPMFGCVPAPHPWLGAKRFNAESPIDIEDLPDIDAVIISHDHYDHLDYASIKKLKDKVKSYYVPLGVGVHLEAWDINKDKITEMDWWDETRFGDILLACTPAQHFSGRKMDNGQSTLWASWVIKTDSASIFFSGDSGYSRHFKEIGERYGPFELALLECGQYNKMWSDIHMFPEETIEAGIDVGAKNVMPIHWGAFKLALHSWTDPIERVSKKAETVRLPLVTPKIGEIIAVDSLPKLNTVWW